MSVPDSAHRVRRALPARRSGSQYGVRALRCCYVYRLGGTQGYHHRMRRVMCYASARYRIARARWYQSHVDTTIAAARYEVRGTGIRGGLVAPYAPTGLAEITSKSTPNSDPRRVAEPAEFTCAPEKGPAAWPGCWVAIRYVSTGHRIASA
eukprot:3941971-Rhodomonas_salina.2